MKRNFLFTLLNTLLLVCSCGSIKTNVSVLKPQYLDGIKMEAQKYSQLRAAYQQDKAFIQNQYAKDIAELDKIYKLLADCYQNKAKTFEPDSDPRNTLEGFSKRWQNEATRNGEFKKVLFDYIQKISNLNLEIRVELSKDPNYPEVLKGNLPIPHNVVPILKNRWIEVSKLVESIAVQNKNIVNAIRAVNEPPLCVPPKSITQVDVITTKMKETTLLTMGGWEAIHSDPFAYYVASAPPDAWADRYNDVKGFSLFGNSDFIIVLDDKGNFRMKGVTFDPGKVAQMASKVGIQALITAVSIAGVPIPRGTASGSTAPTDTQALASSNAALLATQSSVDNLENEYVNYRNTLIDIAKSIVEKKEDLKKRSKYEAATRAFKETFNSQVTRLTVTTGAK